MSEPRDAGPVEERTRGARDEVAELCSELIRFESVNPTGSERPAAEYVAAKLEEVGLETTLLESEPGRASVVTRIEGTDPSRGALLIHGHLDVVPADPADWTVHPFSGEVRDGCVWGRGAVDMKDMVAMTLAVARDLARTGRKPPRDVVLAFVADEEAGGVLGAHWLVDRHPELFEGATEAVSEVGGHSVTFGGQRSYLLQTGEKALVWVRLTARSPSAHGSRLIRDNSVTRVAEAVVALGRRDWPIRLTRTTEALLAEVARILGRDPTRVGPDELVLETGTASGFLLGTLRTTTNPTVLSAGYKHNVIPEEATALVDIRCLPGEEEQTLAEVRELVGDDIEVDIVHTDVGLETPFEGPLVDTMVGLLRRHDPGATVLPYLMSGGTDNKALSKLGIRGYGFAPLLLPEELDFPAMFHGVDERVPVSALEFGHRVLTDFLLEC